MRYTHFRAQGLFVDSGAIEAGCRSVVTQRLKISGMRWTTRGASAILGLRCEEASGRWDEIIWTQVNTHDRRLIQNLQIRRTPTASGMATAT